MTDAQRLTIRASEIRQRLNEIGGLADDAMTEEIRTEADRLTTEYRDTETRLRAAIAAEPETRESVTLDSEDRERIALRGRARLGGFLLAHMQGREPAGELAEYRAALGVTREGIPIDLFEPAPGEVRRGEVELRADAASTIPATGTGATLAPIQPALFAPSIAPMLGIDMPTVGSGAYTEGTITTSTTAAAVAKGAARESTAAVITPTTATPRRVSARLTLQIEDVAAIGADNFEAALRQNLSMALSAQYDNEAINGSGTDPAVEGVIAQLTDPTNPSAVTNFDAFVAAYADLIDGLWAMTTRDVRMVCNVDAYRLAAKTFRDRVVGADPGVGVSQGDVAFTDYARTHTGGLSTNSRMPATASTIARAIAYRMGRPGVRTACHPVWDTITVDDIYSDSGSGQRHVTMHALVGDKVLLVQPSAYSLVEFKVA